jgi:hypothetical protein
MVPFDSQSYVTEVGPVQLHSNDTEGCMSLWHKKCPRTIFHPVELEVTLLQRGCFVLRWDISLSIP